MQGDIFRKIALISKSRVLDWKEIFKYSLGSIPYALVGHMGVTVKTKKSDLLIELEKDTVLVGQMPKSSCSIINGMALVRKVKCSGLTFFHTAEEILKAAMLYSYNSAREDIVFDMYFEHSVKNIERNRRCSGTISFKKSVGSHVALQWNSFLGLNNNKTELIKFLVSEWEKKNITEEVIYVTYGENVFA